VTPIRHVTPISKDNWGKIIYSGGGGRRTECPYIEKVVSSSDVCDEKIHGSDVCCVVIAFDVKNVVIVTLASSRTCPLKFLLYSCQYMCHFSFFPEKEYIMLVELIM